jgi:hypothetical protein
MHSRRKARIDDVSRVRSSSKGAELQKAESGAKDRRSMNVRGEDFENVQERSWEELSLGR